VSSAAAGGRLMLERENCCLLKQPVHGRLPTSPRPNSRARQAAMDVCTSTKREPPGAPRSSQFAWVCSGSPHLLFFMV
jgi:hypothetical protein